MPTARWSERAFVVSTHLPVFKAATDLVSCQLLCGFAWFSARARPTPIAQNLPSPISDADVGGEVGERSETPCRFHALRTCVAAASNGIVSDPLIRRDHLRRSCLG